MLRMGPTYSGTSRNSANTVPKSRRSKTATSKVLQDQPRQPQGRITVRRRQRTSGADIKNVNRNQRREELGIGCWRGERQPGYAGLDLQTAASTARARPTIKGA